MVFMCIFNLAWIFTASDYDSRMPSVEVSNSWMIYAGLVVNAWVDFYFIKKQVHKWASKCTNKELRAEYKALKREKKQWKFQQLKSQYAQSG